MIKFTLVEEKSFVVYDDLFAVHLCNDNSLEFVFNYGNTKGIQENLERINLLYDTENWIEMKKGSVAILEVFQRHTVKSIKVDLIRNEILIQIDPSIVV